MITKSPYIDNKGNKLLVHSDQLISAIRKSDHIKAKLKPILETLASFLNGENLLCIPSRRSIAKKLQLSRSRVSALISECVKAGLIKSEVRYELARDVDESVTNPPMRRTSNKYTFVLNKVGLFFNQRLRKKYKKTRKAESTKAESTKAESTKAESTKAESTKAESNLPWWLKNKLKKINTLREHQEKKPTSQ